MKKLILLMLMLSPFANADEDKMVPLKEYLEANQKDILKSELLYVTFRCIALYSALPGIFEQIPEEQLKENNKDFDVWDWIDSKLELQKIVQLVSREFHYDLFDSTNDEYMAVMGKNTLPMAQNYYLEAEKSYIKNGEWINEFIYDEVEICDAVAYNYSSQIDKDRLK